MQNVNVAKRARDQCSTVQYIHPDYGPLLELHALTLVSRYYALLVSINKHREVLLSLVREKAAKQG